MRSVMSAIPQARGRFRAWKHEGFAGDATSRAARWRRDAQSLTRRRDRSCESADRLRESRRRTARAVSCCAVAMTRPRRAEPRAIRAIVWTRKCPVRTPGKIDKPLWAPTFGGPAETKKARSVVASSRVPRWAGFAGSPPAAGLPGAVDWPLVQIPADRHATTGTCVLGKSTICANRASAQGVFACGDNKFA